MKVRLADGRVGEIGKTLSPDVANGEAIGITLFRTTGSERFADTVRRFLRRPGGRDLWYPAALDELARDRGLATSTCRQDEWCEVDVPSDLQHARKAVQRWRGTASPHFAAVS